MKFLIKSTALVLSLTALNLSYADEKFEIKNDLFYAQIKAPASSVHHQELTTDGSIMADIQTYYDSNGHITKFIINEEDDVSVATYQPYQGNQRETVVSTTDEKYTVNKLWSSPFSNVASSDSDDILIDTQLDEEGKIVSQKLFTDKDSKPKQVAHFYYLQHGEKKPSVPINSQGKNEIANFITTLEKDSYGSWTKQKEERTDGSVIIHTRTIQYVTQSLSSI